MLLNTQKARYFLWRQNNPEVIYSPLESPREGGFLVEAPRDRQRKRDFGLGTWNVRSVYRAGSMTAVTRELASEREESVVSHHNWLERCYILLTKLHVSAYNGHRQVSTTIKKSLYICVRVC